MTRDLQVLAGDTVVPCESQDGPSNRKPLRSVGSEEAVVGAASEVTLFFPCKGSVPLSSQAMWGEDSGHSVAT